MGALSSIYYDRALYARKGRKGEMADPEDEVWPFVHRKAPAYSCYYSLFEMYAVCLVCQKCGVHGYLLSRFSAYRLTENTEAGQGRSKYVFHVEQKSGRGKNKETNNYIN